MFLFQVFHQRPEPHLNELYSLLKRAKADDDSAREKLLTEYMPFVLKTASRHTGRFIDKNKDDEASIGMIAFNEAIDSYNFDIGAGFLTFSEMVIKRRLTDFARKQQRLKETPMSSVETDENNPVAVAEIQEAFEQYDRDVEAFERRHEIMVYKNLLKAYGIEFSALLKVAPKHKTARERAIEAAKCLANDEQMRSYLLNKRMLPLSLLENKVDISRKTMERQRNYIIAVAVILIEDLPHLKQYISGIM